MRIGFFADMYLPHVSGVTNHISLYKKRFEDLGHEVFVFTFGDRDYDDAEPNVVRSPGMPWGETGWRFALSLSSEARRLAETLDIIHVHHPFQSGRLAAPIAKRGAIPLVFTNHTRYDLYSDAYATFVPSAVRYAFLRASLDGSSDGATSLSPPPPRSPSGSRSSPVSAARRSSPTASTRPPSPTRPHRWTAPSSASAPTTWSSATPAASAPRRTPRGSPRSSRRLRRGRPARGSLVVGDGPSRREAEAALAHAGESDRARFLGMVPYDRVPDYEAAADVFVTGSVSEVHPLVVLEAMAAGLPVVAVSSPGISDTVTDGESGLLAPEPYAGRARGADRAARHRRRAAAAGCRTAARTASAAYSLERTADVLLGHYERLVAARVAR